MRRPPVICLPGRQLLFITIICTSLAITGTTQAALVDNGNGTVTDTCRDIMWLKNADLSGSAMTWDQAVTWADNLVFAGFNDWRLPTALNQNGSGPYFGFNCTGGEMGHLYYSELANIAGGPPANTGPFTDVHTEAAAPGFGRYWLATELSNPLSEAAVMFAFYDGSQGSNHKDQSAYVWAVRTVPEPATILFLGLGAALLKKKRQ